MSECFFCKEEITTSIIWFLKNRKLCCNKPECSKLGTELDKKYKEKMEKIKND